MARRRTNGEGSITYDKAGGRWQGRVSYTDATGAVKRRSVYGPDAATVRQKMADVHARIAAGAPVVDAPGTVSAWLRQWLDTGLAAPGRKVQTQSLYRGVAERHILADAIAKRPLAKLRPADIEAWLARKSDTAVTSRTAYAILTQALAGAVRDGMIPANPAAPVKRPALAHREAEFLSPEQVRAALDAVPDPRWADPFEVMAQTGARKGEVLALRWPDVDLPNRTIRIRHTLARVDHEWVASPAKTARSRRTVPLTPRAVAAIESARERQARDRELKAAAFEDWTDSGWVFTKANGDALDTSVAVKVWQRAARSVGLDHAVTVHTLRHSAASAMLAAGVPLIEVSRILGHSSVAITADTYGHTTTDSARAALDRLGNALG